MLFFSFVSGFKSLMFALTLVRDPLLLNFCMQNNASSCKFSLQRAGCKTITLVTLYPRIIAEYRRSISVNMVIKLPIETPVAIPEVARAKVPVSTKYRLAISQGASVCRPP